MCSATIYWAHIGRVVYAATNEQLAQLTGPGNKENFTMKWHTRDILLGQQKDVEIIGPVEGMDRVVVERVICIGGILGSRTPLESEVGYIRFFFAGFR